MRFVQREISNDLVTAHPEDIDIFSGGGVCPNFALDWIFNDGLISIDGGALQGNIGVCFG